MDPYQPATSLTIHANSIVKAVLFEIAPAQLPCGVLFSSTFRRSRKEYSGI